ncbi:MAG: energy-coupling factor transporter ATPase [Firmicutes bacterium]|nr:energy-coupling factor transporter ATPase [Bacillota bacterium]
MSYNCLEFKNVSYSYSMGPRSMVQALKCVSVAITKGELISVVGASGSGKSTFAKHCNGVLLPEKGRVLVNGKDTSQRKVKARLWQEVGLVMQHPEKQLFEATVFDDVAFGPRNLNLSGQETEQAVGRALDLVGLDVGEVGNLSPFTLSGGEKRRVAIAGVLALFPSILVLDEPLAGLDPSGRKMLLRQLQGLHKNRGMTVILITHNMDDAAAVSDRVMVMDKGAVKACAPVRDIFLSALELESMGLEVPFATRILQSLAEKGYHVSEEYTVEKAAVEIMNIYRNRGGHGV